MSKGTADTDPRPGYILGHSEREIARLRAQAAQVDPITRRFLCEAGIVSGMRVLDVGSGAGDVSFLAAELIGASGEVVGVDLAPAAIDVARLRAAAQSLANVTFLQGNPAAMSFDRPFDAVIGRYVLQFQKDPAAALRAMAAHVRPQGVIVFHEIDWAGLGSFPPVPTFDQVCQWGAATMRQHGTETHMGMKLHETFVGAGLQAPTMRLEAPVGGTAANGVWLGRFKELIATLLPEMGRLGVATAEQVDIETLIERINAEAARTNSVIIGHFQVGAWARR
jgi:ubiquinone/menaquinone biosynthesis C-methylase UbiE